MLPASVEDRDFILNGVKDGFKLSVIYGPHLLVDRDNYTSAFRFRSAVEKQIKLEIELRNYIVIKTKPVMDTMLLPKLLQNLQKTCMRLRTRITSCSKKLQLFTF